MKSAPSLLHLILVVPAVLPAALPAQATCSVELRELLPRARPDGWAGPFPGLRLELRALDPDDLEAPPARPGVARHLVIRGQGLDDATVAAVLAQARGLALAGLALPGATRLSARALADLPRLEGLRWLDVSGCTGIGAELLPVLQKLPALRWLRHDGSGIGDDDLALWAGALGERLRNYEVAATLRRRSLAQGLVGTAAAVVEDGVLVWAGGVGYADLETGRRADTATRFRWASISKPLCAIAALQLAERDALDLDADVRRYVPGFPDKGATITTRLLLGHLGGIVHYRNGKVVRREREYDVEHPFVDLQNAVDLFADSPLVAEPGTRYSYSTHGFVLAGAAVARAGGSPFAAQVRERIADPLGMDTLEPDYPWVETPERSVGYRRGPEGIAESPSVDVSWKLPGGGFHSSVVDLGRLAEGMCRGALLREASWQAAWTVQRTKAGKPTGYGLGFGVGEVDGEPSVSHSGAQEETRTHLLVLPGKGLGVALMTNSEWARTGGITRALLQELGRGPR